MYLVSSGGFQASRTTCHVSIPHFEISGEKIRKFIKNVKNIKNFLRFFCDLCVSLGMKIRKICKNRVIKHVHHGLRKLILYVKEKA